MNKKYYLAYLTSSRGETCVNSREEVLGESLKDVQDLVMREYVESLGLEEGEEVDEFVEVIKSVDDSFGLVSLSEEDYCIVSDVKFSDEEVCSF
jgi:hypothetical protein